METREFTVQGMHCTGCETTLGKVVGLVDGVTEARADWQSGRLVVTFDPATAGVEAIREAIEQAGYELVG
jgi:copper chaperone